MITNIFATLTNWIKSDWNRQKKFPQVKEEMTVVKVYVDYALLSAPLLSQLMGINIHMDHPAPIHVILIIFFCLKISIFKLITLHFFGFKADNLVKCLELKFQQYCKILKTNNFPLVKQILAWSCTGLGYW